MGNIMRQIGWAAPILMALAIYSCESARAQSKPSANTSNALAPQWNHNGSVVSLVASGKKQRLLYDAPRIGLLDAGVKPGTLLFEGQRSGKTWTGTAYQFYRTCKSRGFQVSGDASEDLRQITLKGKAPLLDANCNVTGSRDDVLIFTASQAAPSKPPSDVPVAATSGATAATQPLKDASPASTASVASAVAPNAPPISGSASDKPAAAPAAAKPSEVKTPDKAASTSAPAPGEDVKEKQTPKTPEMEAVKVPPSEPAKETQQAAVPRNTSDTASSLAAASTATPSSEPAKDKNPSTAPGAESKPAKTDASDAVNTPAQRAAAAPPSEPPKEAQVVAITGESGTSSAKIDDASKQKGSAATGGAANELRAVTKLEASDADKTRTLIENKTGAAGSSEKMMEIVLKNGRVLRIGRDIEPDALMRIISLLER